MTKLILTLFLKLSYLTKSILAVALSIFDDLIMFFDDIGLYILHSVRYIRFEEIREYTVREKRIINMVKSIVAKNLLKYFDIKII